MLLVTAPALVLALVGPTPAASTGAHHSGAAPPLRGSILFTGGPGGLDEDHIDSVYAVDARGGKLRDLLVDAYEAHWSPDGTRLAFLRRETPFRAGPEDLVVMQANGSGLKVVTRLTRHDNLEPNFTMSPDGKRIVYRDRVDGNEVLFTIGVDGHNKKRLGEGASPIWSPDGRRIAFLREDPSLPNGFGPQRSLWVVEVNGARPPRQLTSGREVLSLSLQSWSPDGRRIVFDYCCRDRGISIVDASGSGRTKSYLVGKVFGSPSWSPNGKWIALDDLTTGSALLIRPDGSGPRRLFYAQGRGLDLSWSPDSRALAFVDSTPWEDIWVVSIADGRPRRVTSGERHDYTTWDPEWQPGGLPTSKLAGRTVEHSTPTDSVPESATVLKTTRTIERLVADGSAVAVDYRQNSRSDVWRPALRSVIRFKNVGVATAIAGERVYWMSGPGRGAGSDLWAILTATFAVPRVASVEHAWPGSHPFSDPVADGSLLAISNWGTCRVTMNPPCAREPKTNGTLFRVEGTRAIRIAASAGPLTPVAVDGGRILVDRENGTYELRRPDGSVIRTFELNASIVRGVKMQGRDLVVLTPTVVEVTDTETGAFRRRWSAPAGAQLVDVQDGIATLVADGAVHLLRLTDGRAAVINPGGSRPVLAQLEPSGLFYSYRAADQRYPGRVVFVPAAELPLR